MENSMKIKLSTYGLISAFSFIYLVLTNNPGVSVPIFTIIQFVSIYYVVRKRDEVKNIKGLYIFIPIFILSLNYYISGSDLWRTPNFFCIVILYNIMVLIITDEFQIKETNSRLFRKLFYNIIVTIINCNVPFKWINSNNNDERKKQLIRRVFLGIIISLPCVIFLLVMLSSADMVFSNKVGNSVQWFAYALNFNYIFKFIYGMIVGLYLFGLLYIAFLKKTAEKFENEINVENNIINKQKKRDVTVINILMFSILLVYTMFIFIQFKYLFAGSMLPDNLNYSEYARRGFFELIFLSGLNVGLILITINLFKDNIYNLKDKWSYITKIFMMYLCIITFIMLISSFYRMNLYDQEYGFTRLRILVYGFLIFESIGIAMTLKFIIKPNFNIIVVYLVIGLCYYMCLNVVQIDSVIAKRNIDMYFAGETDSIDIDYLMTNLSLDAAPEIMRLKDGNDVDILIKNKADLYFEKIKERRDENSNWQSRNYSENRAMKLINNYKFK